MLFLENKQHPEIKKNQNKEWNIKYPTKNESLEKELKKLISIKLNKIPWFPSSNASKIINIKIGFLIKLWEEMWKQTTPINQQEPN